jgi:hypothetical protein
MVDLLEDASPDAEAPYEGKLKDALRFMGKRSRNELFRTLMEEEEMKKMHPVSLSCLILICMPFTIRPAVRYTPGMRLQHLLQHRNWLAVSRACIFIYDMCVL